jgi:hypothetical protein
MLFLKFVLWRLLSGLCSQTRAPAMEENDADDELLYSEEDEAG